MFINKSKDGTNNICGKNIAVLRKKCRYITKNFGR